MSEIHVDTDELGDLVKALRSAIEDLDAAKNEVAGAIDSATGYDGQLRAKVVAIAGEDPGLARILTNDLDELARVLGEIATAFEVADAVAISSPRLGAALHRAVDDGLRLTSLPSWIDKNTPFPEWFVERWDKRAGKYRSDSFEELYQYLKEFASGPVPHNLGTEEDMWNAFAVFLFMKGAIESCPAGEVWRSGAKSAGMELDGYVATVTGVKEAHVEAWLKAGATHGFDESTTIGEMAEMAKAGETIEEHFEYGAVGDWSEEDRDDMAEGVLMLAHGMAEVTGEEGSVAGIFKEVFGSPQFELKASGDQSSWWCTGFGYGFECEPLTEGHMSPQLGVHELGHTLNARIVNKLNDEVDALFSTGRILADELDATRKSALLLAPYEQLRNASITANINGDVQHVAGANSMGVYERTELGYALTENSSGYLSRFPNQQHPLTMDGGNTPNEDFADMLLNWAFGSFTNDPAGAARQAWMRQQMGKLVEYATEPFRDTWLAGIDR